MDLCWFIAALFASSFVGCLASTPKNVARGKAVKQSSTYTSLNLIPDHAVDGDISSAVSKLAHTNGTGSNWWSVDLGQQYKIGKVIIFGRTDTDRDMSKVYILTSNKSSPPPPSPINTDWEIVYYLGEPVLSDREEITLYLTTSYQHLALYRKEGNIITREVEVYNWTGHSPQTQTLSQTADQSSVFYGANASLAVDGRTDMRGLFATYSSTDSNKTLTAPHWWRISLMEPCTNCYVRLYPYLRPKKFGFGNFSRLHVITVLSSSSDSPTAPTLPLPSSAQWNTCYNFTKPQNGPIVDRCNGQNIKHVAVFKNTLEALELVEVEVFHAVEDAFISTSLTAANSSCVKMTWSVKSNHFISYFKFYCTGKAAQNISATVEEYTQCGYSPYTQVTCKIEAIGFGSKAVEKTNRTLCKDPAKPTDIVVKQEDQRFTELPKNRIQFTISWTESKPNCAGVEYSVTLVGASPRPKPADSMDTQAIFENKIAGAGYTVTVTAIYKPNNKTYVSDSHTFTADSTAPEFGNRRAAVTATTSDCVKLDWETPEYENGAVTKYRYKCNSRVWKEVDSNVKSNNICGFGPYKRVTCEVQAKNNADRWSLSISSSTTTLCAAPTKPTGIVVQQANQTYSAGLPKNRIKFTISWNESKPNCEPGVKYSVKLEGGTSKTTPYSLIRQTIFENITAGRGYKVTVTAKNNLVSNPSVSDPLTVTAHSRAPEFGNKGATVTATSSDCVKVDWITPEYQNGAVTNYKYKCNSRGWTEVDSNVKSNNICGFGAYKRVTCEVQAKNNANVWSSSVTGFATTFCGYPTVPEFNLSDIKTVNGSERRRIIVNILSGGEPKCKSANLTVEFGKTNDKNVSDKKVIVVGLSGQVEFDDLDAVTLYRVKIFATNNVGNVSKPVEKQRETGEVAPYTAPDKFAGTTNDSCVTLKWDKPTRPNGVIIDYTYNCDVWNGTQQDTIKAPVTTANVCNLKSASRVSCNITARNSEGVSPSADTLIVFTLFKFIEQPVEPKTTENKVEGQISVVVPLPIFENKDTKLLYYQFIIEKVKNSPNSRRKRSSSTTPVVQLKQLFNYTVAESLNLSYYVAGQLSPPADRKTIKFNYGTGDISDGFDNKKLDTGVSYKTHYLFTVKLGNKEIPQLIRGNTTFEVYVEPATPSPPNNLAAIVTPIAVVAVLAIVLIPLALFYIKRRRASRKNHSSTSMETFEIGESTSGAVPDSQPDTKPAPKIPILAPNSKPLKKPVVAVKPTGLSIKSKPKDREPETPGEDYVNMTVLPKKKIAAVDRYPLQEYIKNCRENMVHQYQKISSLPKIEMSRASDPDTKGKNRYKGLYPGDSHRVKLINNPNGCDYINASYLDGYKQPNKFIAAMGPLPNTVDDFWLMIWEQNVKTIVMVTRLIEECKDKCAQYWPQSREETVYGEITVKLVAEDAWADYQVRNLHVRKGEEIRHIVQYHYLSWPDHGVPKYTGPFVSFYRKISKDVNDRIKKNQANPSPCVVHCSAGVGRTGTFIALDYLLDQAKEEREVEVFECVKVMRQRRPAMVQKEEQYFFIHAALLEAITSADVSTDPTIMKEKIVEFEQNRRGKLLEEFKITCEESEKIIHDFSSGEDPDNQSYNLTQDILPDNHCRPFLLDSNTDYINAVLINGTHVENQYICTQSPLPTTLNHFWAVIFDQGFATVIITQPNQLNILPSDEFKAGKYTIKKKKVWMDEFPTTEVQIHYKQKPMLKVTMFDMSEIWSDDKFIECRYVITLYETVKRWLQQSKNPKVTVVCRDGATRCGLIINAFNCLEKLELEQQCDVYSSVLISKIRRSELISTVDEYLFIYQVLREYADGYNAYANFD